MGDVLDRVEVFADLAAGERDELRALARPFQLGAGDLLFRQGEPANGLFLVGEGMLEIASRTPGDDAATVSQIAPGEVVGEFALLDAGPRSANVRAVEDSAGLMLPARGFAALLADNGPGALAAIDRLRRLVATRTRATLERLAASSQAEPSELRPGPTPATPAPAAPTPIMLRSINPRFATLGDDDCRELFAAAEAFAVPRGAGLLATGDGSASALFVLRGAARASIERGGQREQVALHGPGEWLGLVAMSDGG
ncbi:MAG: cyclic nucleotide-binding domain-containing protein, partial [Novosphingobium sp.]